MFWLCGATIHCSLFPHQSLSQACRKIAVRLRQPGQMFPDNYLVRWTEGSMFLHLVVWINLRGQERYCRPSLNSVQASALPWSDHMTLAANFKLWLPIHKSGVLPKLVQNGLFQASDPYEHLLVNLPTESPILCACPAPKKELVYFQNDFPESQNMPSLHFYQKTGSFSVKWIWWTVSQVARNTGSARTQMAATSCHSADQREKLGSLNFLTFTLDSRSKPPSCYTPSKQ